MLFKWKLSWLTQYKVRMFFSLRKYIHTCVYAYIYIDTHIHMCVYIYSSISPHYFTSSVHMYLFPTFSPHPPQNLARRHNPSVSWNSKLGENSWASIILLSLTCPPYCQRLCRLSALHPLPWMWAWDPASSFLHHPPIFSITFFSQMMAA